MKRGDSLASGSSEFTIREEVLLLRFFEIIMHVPVTLQVEHRVTTDVIRTEVRKEIVFTKNFLQ